MSSHANHAADVCRDPARREQGRAVGRPQTGAVQEYRRLRQEVRRGSREGTDGMVDGSVI